MRASSLKKKKNFLLEQNTALLEVLPQFQELLSTCPPRGKNDTFFDKNDASSEHKIDDSSIFPLHNRSRTISCP